MSDKITVGGNPTTRNKTTHNDSEFIETALDNRGEWVSKPLGSDSDANTYSRLYNKIGRRLDIQVRVTADGVFLKIPEKM